MSHGNSAVFPLSTETFSNLTDFDTMDLKLVNDILKQNNRRKGILLCNSLFHEMN